MILGSLSPLVVSHYSHTWADHYGARTAQQELMLAALSEGAAAELHVFYPAEPGRPRGGGAGSHRGAPASAGG